MEAGAVREQKGKRNETQLKIAGVGCRHRPWEKEEEEQE